MISLFFLVAFAVVSDIAAETDAKDDLKVFEALKEKTVRQ